MCVLGGGVGWVVRRHASQLDLTGDPGVTYICIAATSVSTVSSCAILDQQDNPGDVHGEVSRIY